MLQTDSVRAVDTATVGPAAKVRRVFQYLAELQKLRTPPCLQISQYSWAQRLRELSNSALPEVQIGFRSDQAEEHPEAILTVRRPVETPCPEPPEVLVAWLKPHWENPKLLPEFDTRHPVESALGTEPTFEQFEDSPARIQAKEGWVTRRELWRERELRVGRALELFRRLFELHNRLEREGESWELLLGEGILHHWRSSAGTIQHPLLLQPVELHYDASIPEFTICDADRGLRLNTSLLRACPDVPGRKLQELSNQLEALPIHPMDESPTNGFLSGLMPLLWADGKLVERIQGTEPQVIRDPVLLLAPRNQGFMQAIEAYLSCLLAEDLPIPLALQRIVGEETGIGQEPVPVDPLFTKSANAQQTMVVERLVNTGCVLVQGPPGTGKTHTIANLIGHLLAEGKTILVTSHTAKALRVVRDHVAEPLRPLCVSVLDQDAASRKQLQEAVEGIVSQLSMSNGETALSDQAHRLRAQRDEIRQRLKEAEERLLLARLDEYRDIVVGGEGTPPSEAARLISQEASWIPGPLLAGAPLPLSEDELEGLYASNQALTALDEEELTRPLPEVAQLLSPEQLQELFREMGESATRHRVGEHLWSLEGQSPEELARLESKLKQCLGSFVNAPAWLMHCADGGLKGGGARRVLDELVESIEQTYLEVDLRAPRIQSQGATVTDPLRWQTVCKSVTTYVREKGKPKILTLLVHGDWKEFLKGARVDAGEPSLPVHFEALEAFVETAVLLDAFQRRWERQAVPLGLPHQQGTASELLATARQYLPRIREAITWHDLVWKPVANQLEQLGLRVQSAELEVEPQTGPHPELQRLLKAIQEVMLPALAFRMHTLRELQLKNDLNAAREALLEGPQSNIVSSLLKGLSDPGERYQEAFKRFHRLQELRAILDERQSLLARLQPVAGNWAKMLASREGVHGAGAMPGNVREAWRLRQFQQELDLRAELDLDKLQQQVSSLKTVLHQVTADYVATLTWLAQIRRTKVKEQQALVGWVDLMKKIGKGTGKRVPELRAAAREKLTECRSSVPVWIMPLSRVVESYHPGKALFDVVILDEASQCDVMGLVALALGKQVVVVGDNEQVSPDAVGQSLDETSTLIEQYLGGVPNKELYDGKTSVYDLARQSFGGTIRLVEHFRCAPEIIQFSNQLCYGGEIRPLRDCSGLAVKPPTVAERVESGARSGKRNPREAEHLLSLLVAACEQPEYAGASMGVISLLGEEQSNDINRMLLQRLSTDEIENRRIVCGSPGQFQGDERDVIFLTMVDTSADGPLSLRSDDRFRKRYNVAASRARDQMWLVHSIDAGTALQGQDLRYQLIRHAESPARMDMGEEETESEFERLVLERLRNSGYQVTPQYPVGMYRIDLVVHGGKRKVAIECDGDRWHLGEERQASDASRQEILERLGWSFIRIRGSEFFRKSTETMQRVFQRLADFGVQPGGGSQPQDGDSELLDRVRRRAAALRWEWSGQPVPEPELPPAQDELAPVQLVDNRFYPARWMPLLSKLVEEGVQVVPGADVMQEGVVVGAYFAEVSSEGASVCLIDASLPEAGGTFANLGRPGLVLFDGDEQAFVKVRALLNGGKAPDLAQESDWDRLLSSLRAQGVEVSETDQAGVVRLNYDGHTRLLSAHAAGPEDELRVNPTSPEAVFEVLTALAQESVNLTHALVLLLMDIVRADGVVLPVEVEILCSFFEHTLGYGPAEMEQVRAWMKDSSDLPDTALMAAQVRTLEPSERELLVRAAFEIACSDGEFHPEERQAVHRLATLLALDPVAYREILAGFESYPEHLPSESEPTTVTEAVREVLAPDSYAQLLGSESPLDCPTLSTEERAELLGNPIWLEWMQALRKSIGNRLAPIWELRGLPWEHSFETLRGMVFLACQLHPELLALGASVTPRDLADDILAALPEEIEPPALWPEVVRCLRRLTDDELTSESAEELVVSYGGATLRRIREVQVLVSFGEETESLRAAAERLVPGQTEESLEAFLGSVLGARWSQLQQLSREVGPLPHEERQRLLEHPVLSSLLATIDAELRDRGGLIGFQALLEIVEQRAGLVYLLPLLRDGLRVMKSGLAEVSWLRGVLDEISLEYPCPVSLAKVQDEIVDRTGMEYAEVESFLRQVQATTAVIACRDILVKYAGPATFEERQAAIRLALPALPEDEFRATYEEVFPEAGDLPEAPDLIDLLDELLVDKNPEKVAAAQKLLQEEFPCPILADTLRDELHEHGLSLSNIESLFDLCQATTAIIDGVEVLVTYDGAESLSDRLGALLLQQPELEARALWKLYQEVYPDSEDEEPEVLEHFSALTGRSVRSPVAEPVALPPSRCAFCFDPMEGTPTCPSCKETSTALKPYVACTVCQATVALDASNPVYHCPDCGQGLPLELIDLPEFRSWLAGALQPMGLPIEQLGLSAAFRNNLTGQRIRSLGELMRFDGKQVMDFPGVGDRSWKELTRLLLGMFPPGNPHRGEVEDFLRSRSETRKLRRTFSPAPIPLRDLDYRPLPLTWLGLERELTARIRASNLGELLEKGLQALPPSDRLRVLASLLELFGRLYPDKDSAPRKLLALHCGKGERPAPQKNLGELALRALERRRAPAPLAALMGDLSANYPGLTLVRLREELEQEPTVVFYQIDNHVGLKDWDPRLLLDVVRKRWDKVSAEAKLVDIGRLPAWPLATWQMIYQVAQEQHDIATLWAAEKYVLEPVTAPELPKIIQILMQEGQPMPVLKLSEKLGWTVAEVWERAAREPEVVRYPFGLRNYVGLRSWETGHEQAASNTWKITGPHVSRILQGRDANDFDLAGWRAVCSVGRTEWTEAELAAAHRILRDLEQQEEEATCKRS